MRMKERPMEWMRFPRGHWLDPIAAGTPAAVAVLLHGPGHATDTVLGVAARWAATVPTTAFVVLDAIVPVDRDDGVDPLLLNRVAQQLEPRLELLDADRLRLGGVLEGGTVALDLVLRHSSRWAGVLAFAPPLIPTL